MSGAPFLGLIMAMLGGGVQGAFVLPMKYMKKWKWENGWLVYTIVCCLILPWLLAVLTTPSIGKIYSEASWSILIAVFGFGAGWGIGSILFGLGASYLGMAMGIAIITGINACLGTLFPIIFLPREKALSSTSIWMILFGMVILIAGVAIVSFAGKLRELSQKKASELPDTAATARGKSLFLGLFICIMAGIFCPMMNFSIFFGKPLQDSAVASGVAQYNAGYVLLALAVTGGAVPQIIYCAYLLSKNKSFGNFSLSGIRINYFHGFMMAFYWILGIALYAFGTFVMGEKGAIWGWPLFLSCTIIVANILGVITKEWKGASKKAFLIMYIGIICLIVAILIVINASSR
jgi:L-rhamnose-H+ transport protein